MTPVATTGGTFFELIVKDEVGSPRASVGLRDRLDPELALGTHRRGAAVVGAKHVVPPP